MLFAVTGPGVERSEALRRELFEMVIAEMGKPLAPKSIFFVSDLPRQVLGNLVSNALRYTAANGEIHLAAKHLDGSLTVSVKDNGSGIPAEILSHIFERSFRGYNLEAEINPAWGWRS